jgi:hypothetical protein
MMELNLPAGLASSTLGVDESTSPFIPLKHLAPDVGGERAAFVAALLSLGPWFVCERRFLLSCLG